jgi:hypothetical protein
VFAVILLVLILLVVLRLQHYGLVLDVVYVYVLFDTSLVVACSGDAGYHSKAGPALRCGKRGSHGMGPYV